MKKPYSAFRASHDDIEHFKNHHEVEMLINAGWELWFAKGDSAQFDDGEVLFRKASMFDLLMPLDQALKIHNAAANQVPQ